MKKSTLIIPILLFCNLVVGQNKIILPTNEATFKIKNSGLTVDGKLSGFSGTINFDPKNLGTSTLNVSVETKTIDTDNNSRDGHLKKSDYFDVETFPKITFQSKKIELTKSGYLATGNLTIKGITKEIKIPFTYSIQKEEGLFSGSFNINRLDFGVGNSSWILSDTVYISLTIRVSN